MERGHHARIFNSGNKRLACWKPAFHLPSTISPHLLHIDPTILLLITNREALLRFVVSLNT